MAEEKLALEGLSCTDCSIKIEDEVNQLEEIDEAKVNFATQDLQVKVKDQNEVEQVLEKTEQIINQVEPEIEVKSAAEEENSTDSSWFDKKLLRLLVGSGLFIAAFFSNLDTGLNLLLYGGAYLIIGNKVLVTTGQNIINGKVFDENFLMTVATIGAFLIGEYPEGVAVMLFYEVGEYVKDKAVNHSRQSIKKLLDIKPTYAHLKTEQQVKKVDPNQIEVGDQIVVKPGEKIPLDGKVVSGTSRLDSSALTGESVPEKVEAGDQVLSGAINKNGSLTIEVTKEFKDSTVNKILDLVENAANKKAPTEKFITKFAKYYTPAVVLGALGLALLPPLFLSGAVFSDWIYRGLIFLVISCPCALVISIPLGFFGGIGAASRQGVLVKGGNYLEALNQLETVVLDKTGTITEGVFEVNELLPAEGWSEEELLKLAAKAEVNSNHPIAKAILAKQAELGEDLAGKKVGPGQELAGKGVKATVNGTEILAGNYKLMEAEKINYDSELDSGTTVHVAYDSKYVGQINISDRLKPDSIEAVKNLTQFGAKKLVMLTGDSQQAAKQVADKLELDNYYAELLPDEKVGQVEKLLEEQGGEDKLAFVGDGINDAPVLARSDIGIAMGGLGSDAAIEAADVVLMNDSLSDLNNALKIASFTRRVVVQNIALALGVKGIVLLLGVFGLASMWGAVFADVGVALLAVVNALRIIREK